MLHTIEQEPMFRYLLGELGEDEQREIEERYFSDTQYFEDLLKLEEDLIDEYRRDKGLSKKCEETDATLVARIEELPETRFAREWINDIVEVTGQADGADACVPVAKMQVVHLQNKRGPVVGIAGFYEAQLEKANDTIRGHEAEELLAHAWADRELVSSLMDTNWLGLKILMILESEALMSASQLIAGANVEMDLVTPVLVRLVRFGAIREDKNLFSLAERGASVIRNLERSITGSQ